MGRFDKYLLQQLLVLFGFFSLILVLVFWVNKAVSLLDALLGDGQTAATFLQLSLLGLPSIITSVLPITAFIAAVFGINQMSSDSELVIVQATGFSPWRLARPVMFFGLIAALMMSILTHLLVPLSLQEASSREAEITRDITARLLTEGKFIHPIEGITFYVRETPPNGELTDIFLSDTRTQGTRQTYMARRALLVEEETGPVLLMFDGAAQNYDIASQRLAVTEFDSFAYGLGGLLGREISSVRRIRAIPTHELLLSTAAVTLETGKPRLEIIHTVHDRMAKALLAAIAPLLGFAALIAGGFSRFGLWRYIFVAFGLLIVVKAIDSAVASHLRKNLEDWPLFYAPHVAALGLFTLWLAYAANPNILRHLRRAKLQGTADTERKDDATKNGDDS